MTAKCKPLAVRLIGRDVELICACGLTLRQPYRAPIAARCPKCGERWG